MALVVEAIYVDYNEMIQNNCCIFELTLIFTCWDHLIPFSLSPMAHLHPNPTQNDSIAIQQEFQSYFNNQKLANVLHNFDMNSDLDYVAFLAAGIPAGSLTAGGNYIKTVEERKMFFGSANVPCDSCHKLPCDNINNIDERALSVLSSAAAYGFWELATSNNG